MKEKQKVKKLNKKEEVLLAEKVKTIQKVQNYINKNFDEVLTSAEIVGILEIMKMDNTYIGRSVRELEERIEKIEKTLEKKNKK